MKASEINGQPNKIEASTRITGEIKSNADFRIDGYLNGSITTSGKVVIGKEGSIEGNIKCLNADIEGRFMGKIEVTCNESIISYCTILVNSNHSSENYKITNAYMPCKC